MDEVEVFAADNRPWRVGSNYKIHVYADDEPVATFASAALAQQAVDEHNTMVMQRIKRERAQQMLRDKIERAAKRDPRGNEETDG